MANPHEPPQARRAARRLTPILVWLLVAMCLSIGVFSLPMIVSWRIPTSGATEIELSRATFFLVQASDLVYALRWVIVPAVFAAGGVLAWLAGRRTT